MKSLLNELYNGNIYPNEQIVLKDPQYRLINRKISDEMQMWEQKLSKDDFNNMEKLQDLLSESTSMENEEHFIYGLKLGAMMMFEIFAGKDGLVRE